MPIITNNMSENERRNIIGEKFTAQGRLINLEGEQSRIYGIGVTVNTVRQFRFESNAVSWPSSAANTPEISGRRLTEPVSIHAFTSAISREGELELNINLNVNVLVHANSFTDRPNSSSANSDQTAFFTAPENGSALISGDTAINDSERALAGHSASALPEPVQTSTPLALSSDLTFHFGVDEQRPKTPPQETRTQYPTTSSQSSHAIDGAVDGSLREQLCDSSAPLATITQPISSPSTQPSSATESLPNINLSLLTDSTQNLTEISPIGSVTRESLLEDGSEQAEVWQRRVARMGGVKAWSGRLPLSAVRRASPLAMGNASAAYLSGAVRSLCVHLLQSSRQHAIMQRHKVTVQPEDVRIALQSPIFQPFMNSIIVPNQ